MAIMKQHKSLADRLTTKSKHHRGLISGILKFAKEHSEAFHMHKGEGGHAHSDHDHDHDKKEHKDHDHDHGGHDHGK